MAAWATVFDSSVDFAEKVPHLQDAAALEASDAAYAEAGERMNGISLEPTAAVIDGDVAAIIYDVLFAGSAAYKDLTGEVVLVDGVWMVTRDTYCGFLASARTPCQ